MLTPQNVIVSADPDCTVRPDIPVIDAHMHLWSSGARDYFAPEYLADLAATGHDVVASVHIECATPWHRPGPAALAPVGETAFLMDQIGAHEGNLHQLAQGIVAFADFRLGEGIAAVLDGHAEVGGARFKGLRMRASLDPDPEVQYPGPEYPLHDLFADPKVAQATRIAGDRGLTVDMLVFHPQLSAFADWARQFPDVRFILNHIGFPAGVGRFTGHEAEVFRDWQHGMARVASLPNVAVKLAGIGISRLGIVPVPEAELVARLARRWVPYVSETIALFGPGRCLYATNAPVDGAACPMRRHLNYHKLLFSTLSDEEQQAIFWKNASRIYSLDLRRAGAG